MSLDTLSWEIEKSMKKIDGKWKDGVGGGRPGASETRARPTESEKERLGFWPLLSYNKFRNGELVHFCLTPDFQLVVAVPFMNS